MLELFKVGAHGRVQLEDLVREGDFFTAEKEDDGVIVLSPVKVNTTGGKRTTAPVDVV